MASIDCPGCSYEIPLDDVTGNPVLEIHAPYCEAKKSNSKDRQKLDKLIFQFKRNFLGIEEK